MSPQATISSLVHPPSPPDGGDTGRGDAVPEVKGGKVSGTVEMGLGVNATGVGGVTTRGLAVKTGVGGVAATGLRVPVTGVGGVTVTGLIVEMTGVGGTTVTGAGVKSESGTARHSMSKPNAPQPSRVASVKQRGSQTSSKPSFSNSM